MEICRNQADFRTLQVQNIKIELVEIVYITSKTIWSYCAQFTLSWPKPAKGNLQDKKKWQATAFFYISVRCAMPSKLELSFLLPPKDPHKVNLFM